MNETPVEELRFLTRASVDFRYPGESADHDQAAEAVAIAGPIRERLGCLFDPATVFRQKS